MIESEESTKVTLTLFAYNQEKYVREAVEAALRQTYSPLEIILSDDHSSDATFEIMTALANQYSGPHTIVLNRNPVNRGFSAHMNGVHHMVSGELIVVATGDDISAPHRVARLMAAWTEANKPSALSSQASVIDEQGIRIADRFMGYEGFLPTPLDDRASCLRRLIKDDHCILLGCTEAWRKDLFFAFGDLADGIIHEDNAMAFRAWLVDGIHYLDEVLVDYRVHGTNVAHQKEQVFKSAKEFHLRELASPRLCRRREAHLLQHRFDLLAAKRMDLIDDAEAIALEHLLTMRISENKAMATWWEASIPARARILSNAIIQPDLRLLVWCGIRLAGIWVYSSIRASVGVLSRMLRRISS